MLPARTEAYWLGSQGCAIPHWYPIVGPWLRSGKDHGRREGHRTRCLAGSDICLGLRNNLRGASCISGSSTVCFASVAIIGSNSGPTITASNMLRHFPAPPLEEGHHRHIECHQRNGTDASSRSSWVPWRHSMKTSKIGLSMVEHLVSCVPRPCEVKVEFSSHMWGDVVPWSITPRSRCS